jgi:hypothetical protein
MRWFILALFLVVTPWEPSLGAEAELANVIKASLIFREQSNTSPDDYPHVLLVYLRLENTHDSDVTWVANSIEDVEAELFDSKGNGVSHPPSAGSVMSNARGYLLPWRSRLDWLISDHGGVSMFDDKVGMEATCALVIGGKGWLIPRSSMSSYSLRLRVRGVPWTENVPPDYSPAEKQKYEVLFDVPKTRIVINDARRGTQMTPPKRRPIPPKKELRNEDRPCPTSKSAAASP